MEELKKVDDRMKKAMETMGEIVIPTTGTPKKTTKIVVPTTKNVTPATKEKTTKIVVPTTENVAPATNPTRKTTKKRYNDPIEVDEDRKGSSRYPLQQQP